MQYLLALRRVLFLIPLAVVALAEPALLLGLAPDSAEGFAAVVLAVQAVAAGLPLTLAFTRPAAADRARRSTRRRARRLPAAAGSTPPG